MPGMEAPQHIFECLVSFAQAIMDQLHCECPAKIPGVSYLFIFKFLIVPLRRASSCGTEIAA